MLYCAILYYVVLYCAILYYVVSYCAILYCVVLPAAKLQKGGRAKVPPKVHPAKKKKTVATKQTSQHALGSTAAAAPHPTQTEKRRKKKKREEEEGGNPARAWRLRKGLPGWTLPRNPGGRPGHSKTCILSHHRHAS